MRTFLLAILLIFIPSPAEWEMVRVSRIERELTAPTGDIIFWHLLGSGLVCSADLDSPGGKLLRNWEGKQVEIGIRPPAQLEEIKR